jgi:hypothetical protein
VVSSQLVRGAEERSPLIELSHPVLIGKRWSVYSFARLLVERRYCGRALLSLLRGLLGLFGGPGGEVVGPVSSGVGDPRRVVALALSPVTVVGQAHHQGGDSQ